MRSWTLGRPAIRVRTRTRTVFPVAAPCARVCVRLLVLVLGRQFCALRASTSPPTGGELGLGIGIGGAESGFSPFPRTGRDLSVVKLGEAP